MAIENPRIQGYNPFYIQTRDGFYELLKDFGLVSQRSSFPLLPVPKSPYSVDYGDRDGVEEYVDNLSYQPIEFDMNFYIRAVSDGPGTMSAYWYWDSQIMPFVTVAVFEFDDGTSGRFDISIDGTRESTIEEIIEFLMESYDGSHPVSEFTFYVDGNPEVGYDIEIATASRCCIKLDTWEEGATVEGGVFNEMPLLPQEQLRQKIDEFMAAIGKGFFMVYNLHTGIGFRKVRFAGFKEDIYIRSDNDRAIATFAISFKADDPTTRITLARRRLGLTTEKFYDCYDLDTSSAKTILGVGSLTDKTGGFAITFHNNWHTHLSGATINGLPLDGLPPEGIDAGEHLFKYDAKTNRITYIDIL